MRALTDRDEIAALLRDDPALHAYELGDLDDAFWPHTAWWTAGAPSADSAGSAHRAVGLPWCGDEARPFPPHGVARWAAHHAARRAGGAVVRVGVPGGDR